MATKIWAKWESSLTAVWLKQDPPCILTYYNPKMQATLQTDASVKGFGACLLQDDRPVYFASKALTNAQKGYIGNLN